MGIDVDVSVSCTTCHAHIDESDHVYCEACATGIANAEQVETGQCGQCRERFNLASLISKIGRGPLCFKCCKDYEAELLKEATRCPAVVANAKSGKKKKR